jgi:hypothetical protein
VFDDETSAADRTEQTQESHAKGPTQGIAHQQYSAQTEQKTADEKHDSYSTPKPLLPVRIWRRLTNWWTDPYRSRGNFPEHLTVFISIVIAVIAGFQWNVYRQQKEIMESGGHQTEQLIEAANIQACAAQKIADASERNAVAAKSFSTSADGIREQTAQAVTELRRAAKDSENSMKVTSENAQKALNASINASRIDERAWVSLLFPIDTFDKKKLEPLGDVAFVIRFKNTGKTPALKIAYDPELMFRPPSDPIPDYDDKAVAGNVYTQLTGIHEAALLAPGEETSIAYPPRGAIRFGPNQIGLMESHTTVLYLVGKVTYHDIFFPDTPERTTKFCAYYSPESGDFVRCPINRTMD